MAGADIGEIRGAISLATGQFTGPVDGVLGKLGKVGESFKAIAGLGALTAGAVSAIGGAIVALGTRGSAVINMRSSFDALTGSIGETSDAMLGTMRGATQGLIGDMDLMAAANKAILLGLPVTADSMGTMAQAAVVLGKAMGQDAKKSVDDLTTALGRQSPMILDNLGLSVKVGDANATYARSIGKTADQLTDAEKKQAFYNAAMAAAQEKVTALGGIHLTFADRITIAKNQLSGFLDSFGVAIAKSPVLAAGFDAVMKAVGGAFGGSQADLVKTLMGYVEDFAIGVTYVGQAAVVAGQVLITAWYAAKTAIGAVLSVVVGVGQGIVQLVAVVADLGTSIPGVGEKLKGFAAGAQQAANFMADLTAGLAAETAENANSVLGHNAAYEALTSVNGALINVRGAMEAAQGSEVALTESTKTFAQANTEAAERAPEDAKKIAGAFQQLEVDLITGQTMGIEQRTALNELAREDELNKLKEYTGLTAEEHVLMVASINEKYDQLNALAAASGDTIRETETKLRQDIAISQATGLEQQLLTIEAGKQQELAALGELAVKYPDVYAKIAELVTQKYQQQTDAALGHFATVQQAAEAAGFKTQADLQRTADIAKDTYNRMKASGLYSAETLQKAWEASQKAQQEATKATGEISAETYLEMASQTVGILKTLFGKSKAVAIAEIIVNTARAVMQAFANYPPPASYIFGALAAAAGIAQIAKVSSSNPGFRWGIPEGQYQDFGRGTSTVLHGRETVVTERQGRSLAADLGGMVEDALGGGRRGTGPVQINLVMPNGRRLWEALLPDLPSTLATYGLTGG